MRQLGFLWILVLLIGCGTKPTDLGEPVSRGVSGSRSEGSTNQATPRPVRSIAAEINKARRLLQQHDVVGASQIADELLLRAPSDASVLTLATMIAVSKRDSEQAIELLRSFPPIAAEMYFEADQSVSELLIQQKQWAKAIAQAKEAVKLYPADDRFRRRLASVLNTRGYRFDANEQIRALLPSGNLTADELRCLMTPDQSYFKFVGRPDVSSPEVIDNAGVLNVTRILLSQGEVRAALKLLQEYDPGKTDDLAGQALLGQLLLESQQYDDLAKWIGSVAVGANRYPSYWMAHGGWALHSKDFRSAVRMFAEAIVREPALLSAYERLAHALQGSGEVALANRFAQQGTDVEFALLRYRELVKQSRVDPNETKVLSDKLVELGRPLEALAWERITAARLEDRRSVARIDLLRERFLAALRPGMKLETILCGLDLSDYPIGDLHQSAPVAESLAVKNAKAKPDRLPVVAPEFVNVARETGLEFQYRNADPPRQRGFRIFEAYGAGVAAIDFDRDGRVDFYNGQAFANLASSHGTVDQYPGKEGNALYRNVGKSFREVGVVSQSDDHGYTFGVTAGDINQDGFADLLVGNLGVNQLLINQGDGTFRQATVDDAYWHDARFTASVAIADINRDHLPDIIEINYLHDDSIFMPTVVSASGEIVDPPRPLQFQPSGDRIYLSQAGDGFQGQALTSAPSEVTLTGLGLVVADIDGQPGNEMFVANDLKANQLWSFSDGQFLDEALLRGVGYGGQGLPLACMGISAADFDGNGRMDLHVTNFASQWSNHYLQNASGLFSDLAAPMQLDIDTLAMVGFGTEAIDYDNNTTLDLVIGNGHIEDMGQGTPFKMPSQLFRNDLDRFVLEQVMSDDYWSQLHLTRGLITCDWNRDGRTDFAVTDLQEPFALLENRTSSANHCVQFVLVGTTCERDATGSRIELLYGDADEPQTAVGFVTTGDGYMSKNEAVVSFGLGPLDSIQQAVVVWADGQRQTFRDLAADGRLLLIQGQSDAYPLISY